MTAGLKCFKRPPRTVHTGCLPKSEPYKRCACLGRRKLDGDKGFHIF